MCSSQLLLDCCSSLDNTPLLYRHCNLRNIEMLSRKFEDVSHVKDYVIHRPKYPTHIFDKVMAYVQEMNTPETFGCFPLAVDVGCGPGTMSTSFLAPYFDKVLGVDISKAQIDQAKIINRHENIEFRNSPAECLPVEDNSVTLIQAATALHWLDHQKFYKECDRVLVPGGVIAAFSYYAPIKIVDHPHSNAMNQILDEINDRLYSRDNEHNQLVVRRYGDKDIQIPYNDSKRVDEIFINRPTTLGNFEKFYLTMTRVRDLINSNEESRAWWECAMKRLMEAYGTEDPDAPLTYQMEVFMLLGRKPGGLANEI